MVEDKDKVTIVVNAREKVVASSRINRKIDEVWTRRQQE